MKPNYTADGILGWIALRAGILSFLLGVLRIFHHRQYRDVPIRFDVEPLFFFMLIFGFAASVCGLIASVLVSQKTQSAFEQCALGFFITVFTGIMLPQFGDSHRTSAQNACINNLRLIDGAKQQWALENKKSSNAVPTVENLRPYLGRGTGPMPSCPADGKYSFNAVADAPTCTITNHWLP